jgi:hypothetical protein
MVNNFTNINKETTTIHLSQFNTQRPQLYDVGNPGIFFGQADYNKK